MEQYILAIDQSTSATKAVLFDREARLVHRYNAEHAQFYPQPGWVEHDPEEIYQRTLEAIQGVLREKNLTEDAVKAIAVTNQRETAVVWDRHTGKPVTNAVVWQCRRGGPACDALKAAGHEPMVKAKTGLVLDPYFSATKVKWVLEHIPEARERAENGDLLFGTIDSWVVWKLTGGKAHVTDYSNASRTLFLNLGTKQWDPDLQNLFGIPASMFPALKHSDEVVGYTDPRQGFPREIPIAGLMGDSHAALFGQHCFAPGMAKATYGTGSSIMMNIGEKPLESHNGLVTSVAWGAGGTVEYVFEGNVHCTGATIKWLVDDLELLSSSKEAGPIAASVTDNDGVYLVPAFAGLGAPYWDHEARATISGLTRGAKKAHLVRAAEEAIAYQIKDVLDLMVQESGVNLAELRVDGGPTRDEFLMQFQADILDVAVTRASIEELSALGSAFMAGLATGFWQSKEELLAFRRPDRTFNGKMEFKERERLYRGWKDAVKRTLSNRG